MQVRSFLFLFLIEISISDAQNSLPVQFPQDPSRNTSIGIFHRGGITYGSINDIAETFHLQTFFNPEVRKIELRANDFMVKVTANNPFIIITDKKENASLIQMPVNTLYAANSFFIPLDAFLPILKNILKENITYERSAIIVRRARRAFKYDVTGLSFEEKSNGLLVRIYCTKEIADYENWLKPIGRDTWLYITLANARADVEAIRRIRPSGMVKQILVFQSPTSVQLTLRVRGEFARPPESMLAEKSNDILVAVHFPSAEQIASRKARVHERSILLKRDRWKLDVVVIDPGHGGEDPGAIGIRRTKEKDITLAIALKLGRLIQKNLKDVNVVYTRKTDKFVELDRRGQIANQSGGKLFVSIHCNSMPRKPHPKKGFEIFLLRPGKSESALRIAERENAVIKFEEDYERRYQQLTEENFILLTMAQSAYMKYSEQFANLLQQEMGKRFDISNSGVKQAGFYVLVGASMPNVLIETAYLSNREDERLLRSSKGQRRIAEAIFNAIRRYKLAYEKSLDEGKDLGENIK